MIVVAFVYLFVTSDQFKAYSLKKIETVNTTIPINISATESFYNVTEYMNESTFITWANTHANNSVVARILSGSNYTEGVTKLKAIWQTINRLYTNSTSSYNAASQLYSQIKNISR
ncbi:MAG: hypothetical protein QXN59_00475 [Candidatus Micrarchaeaceae archaeon]